MTDLEQLRAENTRLRDAQDAQLEEHSAALEAGDLAWAARRMPPGTDQRIVEAAFHKARLECTAVSDEMRIESRDWLIERGLTRFDGSTVAPDGLPK